MIQFLASRNHMKMLMQTFYLHMMIILFWD